MPIQIDRIRLQNLNQERASLQIHSFVKNNGFPIISLGIQCDTKKLLIVALSPMSKNDMIERLMDYLEDLKTAEPW